MLLSRTSLSKPPITVGLAIYQEPRKGGFSKGGFCRVERHAQGDKNNKDIGPSRTFGTQSATAKRGVHSCKTPLLKTPFSWFLNLQISEPPPKARRSLGKKSPEVELGGGGLGTSDHRTFQETKKGRKDQ